MVCNASCDRATTRLETENSTVHWKMLKRRREPRSQNTAASKLSPTPLSLARVWRRHTVVMMEVYGWRDAECTVHTTLQLHYISCSLQCSQPHACDAVNALVLYYLLFIPISRIFYLLVLVYLLLHNMLSPMSSLPNLLGLKSSAE